MEFTHHSQTSTRTSSQPPKLLFLAVATQAQVGLQPKRTLQKAVFSQTKITSTGCTDKLPSKVLHKVSKIRTPQRPTTSKSFSQNKRKRLSKLTPQTRSTLRWYTSPWLISSWETQVSFPKVALSRTQMTIGLRTLTLPTKSDRRRRSRCFMSQKTSTKRRLWTNLLLALIQIWRPRSYKMTKLLPGSTAARISEAIWWLQR